MKPTINLFFIDVDFKKPEENRLSEVVAHFNSEEIYDGAREEVHLNIESVCSVGINSEIQSLESAVNKEGINIFVVIYGDDTYASMEGVKNFLTKNDRLIVIYSLSIEQNILGIAQELKFLYEQECLVTVIFDYFVDNNPEDCWLKQLERGILTFITPFRKIFAGRK